MTTAAQILGLDANRWARVRPTAVWPASMMVVGVFGLMGLLRVGGLVFDEGQAFTRITVVGVYGWVALSLVVWLVLEQPWRKSATDPPRPFLTTFVLLGLAHSPLLAFGLLVYATAGLFDLLGPGQVMGVFVLFFWLPSALASAAAFAHRVTFTRALLVLVGPYVVWLATIARYYHGQIQHLL